MRRKYPPVRFPAEVRDELIRRQKSMEDRIKRLTNRQNVKLPLTDVMRLIAKKQVYVYDDELMEFYTKNKRKNKGMML